MYLTDTLPLYRISYNLLGHNKSFIAMLQVIDKSKEILFFHFKAVNIYIISYNLDFW
jgi:hypothetical protein